MPYIISTITNDTSYTEYHNPTDAGMQVRSIKRKVTIKGGTGVADKRVFTPKGVITEVTDDDLEFLKNNEAFKRHTARGFLTVQAFKRDPEKIADDMKIGDGSEPKTPDTIEKVPSIAKVADGSAESLMDKISKRFAG